jgi:hypothetical protein
MKIIYHYTHCHHLQNIIADGIIKKEGCNRECNRRGDPLSPLPVVWFSTNDVWERTASKTIETPDWSRHTRLVLDTPTKVSDWLGLARIVVPETVASMRWDQYADMIPKRLSKTLKKVAYRIGSRPSEWRISMAEVPADKWCYIDTWQDGVWHSYSVAEAVAVADKIYAESLFTQLNKAVGVGA